MANAKISELTDGTTANAADEIIVARDGTNGTMTLSQLKEFLKPGSTAFAVGEAVV